ncbi:hypothetical protein IEQ34_023132 [Dendrobium chrysotoxum]|uniref:Uncharacterized protein n=1 Tax=Dendrobium chrysotoxum TaxID=161865 RepID=A0AAV7G104_DENCH|nr:hypothetical protein IEQ34_023132 [Dendrobium chrysotoxum]
MHAFLGVVGLKTTATVSPTPTMHVFLDVVSFKKIYGKEVIREGMLHSYDELLLMLDVDGAIKNTSYGHRLFTKICAKKFFRNIQLKG